MPSDDEFLSLPSGALQARIQTGTGVIELSGPNRAGAPNATTIRIAAISAKFPNNTRALRAVRSSSVSADVLELVQDFGTGKVRARLSFPFPSVMRFEVIDWQGQVPDSVSIAIEAGANEHYYGFGEKFNSLDQAGKIVDILTFDNPGNKGGRSYKVAPWFLSTRGYGIHLDTTARSTFDMRTADSGRYVITNRIGKLKFHVVYGPQLTDVLSRYSSFAGHPSLPPPFAFGTWISSDIWRSGGEVRYAVEKFRERKIAASVFVFDSPWEVSYNDFKFNIGSPSNSQFGRGQTLEGKTFAGFSSLAEMMTFFRENGLKVVCWMTPFINKDSVSDGVPGQNRGAAFLTDVNDKLFVQDKETSKPLLVSWWKGRGHPIDFSQTAACDWLKSRLSELVKQCEVSTRSGRETAIGGFKTDDGEFGNGQNTYIPDKATYGNGETGKSFVNGYCVDYHKTVSSVLGARGVLFARSGYTGSQAFSGCWAGDNEPNFGEENGLPSVIVAGLSAAMSGYSIWGHDIGGYLNGNFSPVAPADLLIRWTQFGCFSPIMQMHRQVDAQNLRQYPWGYPDAGETFHQNRALENFQFYARLHARLFPYIFTYAKQSSENGIPILRPLVLIHPDDARAYGVRHTYYFGGELVVAPIIRPNSTTRDVYLPRGRWFDFWSNRVHEGAQVVHWNSPNEIATPRSKIPVFVRAGAIIPFLLDKDIQSLCDDDYVNNSAVRTRNAGLELRIYPDKESKFTMFDGTTIRCDQALSKTKISLDSTLARPVLLRVFTSRPANVRQDGVVLPEISAPAAFEASTTGWRFDASLGEVLVKYSHSSGESETFV